MTPQKLSVQSATKIVFNFTQTRMVLNVITRIFTQIMSTVTRLTYESDLSGA